MCQAIDHHSNTSWSGPPTRLIGMKTEAKEMRGVTNVCTNSSTGSGSEIELITASIVCSYANVNRIIGVNGILNLGGGMAALRMSMSAIQII